MRLIRALTLLYIVFVATFMNGRSVGAAITSEILFAGPALAACFVSFLFRGRASDFIMAIFVLVYFSYSAYLYHEILTAYHDAQWQLAFLLIPIRGFTGVAIAGTIAAISWSVERLSRGKR